MHVLGVTKLYKKNFGFCESFLSDWYNTPMKKEKRKSSNKNSEKSESSLLF
jgi:hypothetical protein